MAAAPPEAGEFLKAQKPIAARRLRQSAILSLGSASLIVVQAWLIASVINAVAFERATLGDVGHWVLLLPLVFGSRAALTWCAEAAASDAAAHVKRAIRQRVVEHVVRLGPVALAGQPTGTLVAAANDSLQAVEPYFSRYLPAATLAAVLPLVILAAVAPHDWMSAVVLVLTAPCIPLFMVLIGHGVERLSQRQWHKLTRMSGHFLDVIQGLETLKAFNASRREAERVARVAEDYRRDTMAVLRVAFLSSLTLEFFATVSIAIVAVLIGFRLLWGEMAFFNGLFVLLLAPEFYAPLRALGAAYHARMEAVGAAVRIVEVLSMPAPARPAGMRQLGNGEGISIRFEDVHVAFPDGRQALRGLSFAVAARERAAIVGPSGAGKTTVLNLLLGFLAPTSGRILVNGVPLAELDLEAWRRRIAYLPQRPHIYEATVSRNIAMALDGGPVDLARIREAARRATVDAVIAGLADGYETILGERGAGLSKGEAHRVALARAFYRDAPLALLDEASAHLDHESEGLIASAVSHLAQDRTVLAVAHRLATVRTFDRILVLDRGALAEEGDHAGLLANGGLYARLWSQAQPDPARVQMP